MKLAKYKVTNKILAVFALSLSKVITGMQLGYHIA